MIALNIIDFSMILEYDHDLSMIIELSMVEHVFHDFSIILFIREKRGRPPVAARLRL